MTEPEAPPLEGVTAWHPMLVALLEFYLPSGWRLSPELLLNRMPLRVDIVVLRLVDQPAGDARKLHSIFGHLRQHTLTLPLDPEEARVYNVLYQQVEQLRRQRGTMAMKDHELARQCYEEVLEQMLAQLPPEKLLARLTPEQRLAGLTPEEILPAIPPKVQELLAKKLSRDEP